MTDHRTAPVYLNLFRIRFPAAAVTSILHRIAGVLLFLSLPFLVWLLGLSLQDAAGYARAIELLRPCWIRLGSVLIAWSLLHHLLAGIRFLLIDIDIGVTMPAARISAWAVNLTAIALALLYLGWVL